MSHRTHTHPPDTTPFTEAQSDALRRVAVDLQRAADAIARTGDRDALHAAAALEWLAVAFVARIRCDLALREHQADQRPHSVKVLTFAHDIEGDVFAELFREVTEYARSGVHGSLSTPARVAYAIEHGCSAYEDSEPGEAGDAMRDAFVDESERVEIDTLAIRAWLREQAGGPAPMALGCAPERVACVL